MRSDVVRLHAELEERHWWFRARREVVLGLLEDLLYSTTSPLVLDVGCGTGANAALIDSSFHCVGVDPNKEAIRTARKRYRNVGFRYGQAPSDVSEWIGKAAVILLMDVLEHVADDRRLLRELVNSARPGALFLLTVPANPQLWSSHDEAHGHYRRYTDHDLTRLAETVSLEVELLSHFNSRLYPLIWCVRRIGQLLGVTIGASETDLRLPPSTVNEFLFRVFKGELSRLRSALNQEDVSGYRNGLSLLLVGRKRDEPSSLTSLAPPQDGLS